MSQQNEKALWMERRMGHALEQRRKRGTLRSLRYSDADGPERDRGGGGPEGLGVGQLELDGGAIDFSSNDYLGLARSPDQARRCRERIASWIDVEAKGRDSSSASHAASSTGRPAPVLLGATGSRLLSGDSRLFHLLEGRLARVHGRQAALLCNSGYDANLAVVSSLPCDAIVHDELVHNSLHMGMRLWKSEPASMSPSSSSRRDRVGLAFRHNCALDLERQLQRLLQRPPAPSGTLHSLPSIVVLIESVYSMDGDVAPVKLMLDVCAKYGAQLVVDEAHGLGVFGAEGPGIEFYGTGVLARDGVESHPALLCSVHTFGKAAGCHGAVICGSKTLKSFLVNYGYPVIYSTALPVHSLIAIQCAYETMTSLAGESLRNDLFRLVRQFRVSLVSRIGCADEAASLPTQPANGRVYLLPSCSPIQALMIPGNHRCTEFCRLLFRRSKGRICLYPIKSPTVPSGQERVRIVLHAHNTPAEVENLVSLVHGSLRIMGLLPNGNDWASFPATVQSKL